MNKIFSGSIRYMVFGMTLAFSMNPGVLWAEESTSEPSSIAAEVSEQIITNISAENSTALQAETTAPEMIPAVASPAEDKVAETSSVALESEPANAEASPAAIAESEPEITAPVADNIPAPEVLPTSQAAALSLRDDAKVVLHVQNKNIHNCYEHVDQGADCIKLFTADLSKAGFDNSRIYIPQDAHFPGEVWVLAAKGYDSNDQWSTDTTAFRDFCENIGWHSIVVQTQGE